MIEEGRIPAASEVDNESGSIELLVTDLPAGFQSVADLFLGKHIPDVQQIDLVMS